MTSPPIGSLEMSTAGTDTNPNYPGGTLYKDYLAEYSQNVTKFDPTTNITKGPFLSSGTTNNTLFYNDFTKSSKCNLDSTFG